MRSTWLAPAVVFVVALAVYGATLARTVQVGDAGELISCAHTLGVAHPTGYPLYCLAGRAADLVLPGPTPAFRLNLFSAILAALASAFAAGIVFVATTSPVAAVLGGLFVAFSPSLWSQATSAEVYTLHVALMSATLFILSLASARRFVAAAALLGLACTNHITAVIWLPALAAAALFDEPALARDRRRLGLLAAALLLPLALYLYLPLRSMANPPNDWGDPETLQRLWAHVTGAQYQRRLLSTGFTGWLGNLSEYGAALRDEIGLLGIIAATAGALTLLRQGRRSLLAALTLAAAANVLFYTNYSAFDVADFFVPSHIVWGTLAGIGLGALPLPAMALAVVLPASQLWTNYARVDRSASRIALDRAENLFRSLPPNATVFAEGSGSLFLLEYLQLCEGRRPDVRIVGSYGKIFAELFRGVPREHREAVEDQYVRTTTRPVFFTARRSMSGLPGHTLVPWGLAYRLLRPGETLPARRPQLAWTDWPLDARAEDLKTREILAQYEFFRGLQLWEAGRKRPAVTALRSAQQLAFGHFYMLSQIGRAFIRFELPHDARRALRQALRVPLAFASEDRSATRRDLESVEETLRRRPPAPGLRIPVPAKPKRKSSPPMGVRTASRPAPGATGRPAAPRRL